MNTPTPQPNVTEAHWKAAQDLFPLPDGIHQASTIALYENKWESVSSTLARHFPAPVTPDSATPLASKEWFEKSARLEGDSAVGAGLPAPDSAKTDLWLALAREAAQLLIIDAAVEVAVFSKTHRWPEEASLDFFKFATLLDDLATKIAKRYPEFNKNVLAAQRPTTKGGA